MKMINFKNIDLRMMVGDSPRLDGGNDTHRFKARAQVIRKKLK
jgi:hypothetical protein